MSTDSGTQWVCDHGWPKGWLCGPCRGITQEEANRICREALDKAVNEMKENNNDQ